MRATHARIPPRSTAASRARTWWGKAWVRAVEEAAYGEDDLRRGRALARAGRVGGITIEGGRLVAAVEEGDDVLTVTGAVPVLDDADRNALVEAVAAESGRITALLAGELPHGLVEHAEEVGAELLPYGGELATRCTCEPWTDPCRHGVAVLTQLGWLLEADPFVLLGLRGLDREELLARLHAGVASGTTGSESGNDEVDLDVAVAAVRRATDLLAALEQADGA